ncbi:OmpA family protein [Paracoccus sediminis]|uniref:OmpA family protein n=1 Tax=Paracoccus sediminis TaxID=1214787 RepID=A0A238W6C6_9RHOB|nr:OmpA family protein [Paracoccus sediminis]TBN51597.1 OmpA family protein [Paracoccus sediminis]SNR41864.1 OmpA-OmpF porin, OOP family [Paracoccus sediminis]
MASFRRLLSPIASIVVLTAAGGLCWLGAQTVADHIERQSRDDVQQALEASNQDWVGVTTDGLQVGLSGMAPSEVERFRALTQAGTVVDPSRLVDRMTVVSAQAMTPPDFSVELLRNDQGISLIGLVPTETDRAGLVRALRDETAAPQIADLLESADYPVPGQWNAALQFGLRAARLAPRAKISIRPGSVAVSAIADDADEKGRLESALRDTLPDGVTLTTEISAPRPVITPFALRFVADDWGVRFEACAADTAEGRDRIVAAAMEAGAVNVPACTLGLGSPSPDWSEAAVAAIKAVAALGRGSVTLSDADVSLSAPATVDKAAFDAAVARLQPSLPRPFSLQSELEPAPGGANQAPMEFTATLSDARILDMQGPISDDRMRDTVDSLVRARFPTVQGSLTNDPSVPRGWTVRIIGAIEALDTLRSGSVQVTPDLIRVTGTSGDPAATETAAARLSERLGPGAAYELAIRYDRRLDTALNLPDGAECVRRLNIVMSESEIGFEPSKSAIAGDPGPTLDRLATTMAECANFQIEAGGHTDAQGSERFNADLSRGRAQALVAAMTDAGIDTANMTARGYGESQPIATNETDEGREENRRIEFRLLSDHPVRSDPLPAPVTRTGVTAEPVAPLPPAPALIGPIQPAPAPAVPQMFGPALPQASTGPTAPATVGVSEVFQTLDEREESIRLPVQAPTPDTPRPLARPDEAGAPAPQIGTGPP